MVWVSDMIAVGSRFQESYIQALLTVSLHGGDLDLLCVL